MRALAYSLALWLFCGAGALAALHFPALTGHVVDNAHILSPSAAASLDETLADYERGTTNQVVVVTLPSLEGDSIEDYGYQLGRYWKIGQKGKDNGALFIIVPGEHKVRIEVGYGLEPVLTDAQASEIIHQVVLPDFRAGRMAQGVVEGTQTILSVLGGKGMPGGNSAAPAPLSGMQTLLVLVGIFLFFLFSVRHPFIAAYFLMSGPSRFGSSRLGDSGWGGGGGGSFGGGGASGSW